MKTGGSRKNADITGPSQTFVTLGTICRKCRKIPAKGLGKMICLKAGNSHRAKSPLKSCKLTQRGFEKVIKYSNYPSHANHSDYGSNANSRKLVGKDQPDDTTDTYT